MEQGAGRGNLNVLAAEIADAFSTQATSLDLAQALAAWFSQAKLKFVRVSIRSGHGLFVSDNLLQPGPLQPSVVSLHNSLAGAAMKAQQPIVMDTGACRQALLDSPAGLRQVWCLPSAFHPAISRAAAELDARQESALSSGMPPSPTGSAASASTADSLAGRGRLQYVGALMVGLAQPANASTQRALAALADALAPYLLVLCLSKLSEMTALLRLRAADCCCCAGEEEPLQDLPPADACEPPGPPRPALSAGDAGQQAAQLAMMSAHSSPGASLMGPELGAAVQAAALAAASAPAPGRAAEQLSAAMAATLGCGSSLGCRPSLPSPAASDSSEGSNESPSAIGPVNAAPSTAAAPAGSSARSTNGSGGSGAGLSHMHAATAGAERVSQEDESEGEVCQLVPRAGPAGRQAAPGKAGWAAAFFRRAGGAEAAEAAEAGDEDQQQLLRRQLKQQALQQQHNKHAVAAAAGKPSKRQPPAAGPVRHPLLLTFAASQLERAYTRHFNAAQAGADRVFALIYLAAAVCMAALGAAVPPPGAGGGHGGTAALLGLPLPICATVGLLAAPALVRAAVGEAKYAAVREPLLTVTLLGQALVCRASRLPTFLSTLPRQALAGLAAGDAGSVALPALLSAAGFESVFFLPLLWQMRLAAFLPTQVFCVLLILTGLPAPCSSPPASASLAAKLAGRLTARAAPCLPPALVARVALQLAGAALLPVLALRFMERRSREQFVAAQYALDYSAGAEEEQR